jgi:predicted RNA-binding protein with PIN domain
MIGYFGRWEPGERDKLARMNYMIDGHNLIAHLPGLTLSMPDDEEQLIGLLNRFGETQRGKLEAYFDDAPAGQAGKRNFGRVQAHFVTERSTADEAIKTRLGRLGKTAHSWIVVTSDRSVQAAARERHARVMKSEDFAQLLLATIRSGSTGEPSPADLPLSQAEVDEWLKIFKERKSTK